MRPTTRSLLLTGVSLCIATQASAQDDTGQIGVIIVTGQKNSGENLQETPLSITAFEGEQLEELGLQNVEQLAAQTPGLTVKSDFGFANPNIFIRGVGITDFNANVTGAVSVYVDEIYQSSPAGQLAQFFDTQRVEVLRGPQGTLYGRNTSAGAINVIPNRPTDSLEIGASAGYGRFDEVELNGVLSGPITSSGTVKARLAGTYHSRNGTVRNTFQGPMQSPARLSDINFVATRLLVDITPTDSFEVKINGHYGLSDTAGAAFIHRGLFGATGICNLDEIASFSCVDALGYRENDSDPDTTEIDALSVERIETWGANVSATTWFGDYSLNAILGYEGVDRDTEFDVDDSPNPLVSATNRPNSDEFTAELRISSPKESSIRWIAGAYYFEEDLDFVGDFRLLGGALAWDYAYNQNVSSWAIFGQGYLDISDRLTATVGLRYSDEARTFDYRSFINGGLAVEISPELDNNRTNFTDVSWRAALEFEASDDIFLFGSVSRGSKSGGFNGAMLQDPVQAVPFDDESVISYEIGFKSDWLNRSLRVNATAFYYDYRDLQVYILQPALSGGLPQNVLSNAPKAAVYGAEIEMTALPTPNLLVQTGVSLLHTEITEMFLGGGGEDLDGNQLPYAPEFSINGLATYTHDLPGGATIQATADFSFREAGFTDILNLDRMRYEEGIILGANVTFTSADDQWRLSVWGRNITDNRHLTYVGDVVDLGFQRLKYTEPATYGITLSFDY